MLCNVKKMLRLPALAGCIVVLFVGLILGVCFTAAESLSIGDITTAAGGGVSDKTVATSANVNSPMAVAVDSAGNCYVADSGNHRVRKIAAGTGVITTVAGSGNAGFSGDNGAATAADLHGPTGVAVDDKGNLYIADSMNYRIRKVAAMTGVITTVAGDGTYGYSGDDVAATATSLAYPSGVAVDSAGNIFIADGGNSRIRKVAAGSGIITTVAGNGSAGYSGDSGAATAAALCYPSGVAVDKANNVYIADTSNHRIREVVAGTGTITTIAGNGSAGYSGDRGAATDAALNYPYGVGLDSSGNLYIADRENSVVRKVSSGIITTVAGTGSASFSGDNGPATDATLSNATGVAVDSAGKIYIADPNNNRIRQVNATGIITTVAGNGSAGYSGDNGVATAASLSNPFGVAVDGGGNLYIADNLNNRVRKVAVGTGIITTVAGTGSAAYSGDAGAATAATLDMPLAVAVDGSGNLFIADSRNNRIRKVAAGTGIITTVAGNGTYGYSGDNGPATAAALRQPTGVAVDGSGNIFIADNLNNRIRKVTPTGIITTVAGNGNGGYSGDNGPATSATLYNPFGVAVDSAGNLLIADFLNHRVRKVAANGVITTVAGIGMNGYAGDNGAAVDARLNGPLGVAIDGAGNVCIAEQNNRIRLVSAGTGIITTVAGNGSRGYSGDGGLAISASLANPSGIAVDGNGNLYISDSGNNRIRKVYLKSTPPAISGTAAATVIAESPYSFTPASTNASSYSIVNKPTWGSFDTSSGTLSGTPTVADVGSYDGIIITAANSAGTVNLPAFSITVQSATPPPTIAGTPPSVATAGTCYSFTPSVSGASTFSITGKPRWASFDPATGGLTGTPTDADAGSYDDIVISATNSAGSASLAPFSITVTAANHAPTIAGTPTVGGTEGTWYSFNPTAGDVDGDPLTFSIVNKPGWATFSTATGALTGTPVAGTFADIQISVSDGKGGSASLPGFSVVVASTAGSGGSGNGGGTGGSGSGGAGTPVPVMDGVWVLPGVLAGFGLISRRRKR